MRPARLLPDAVLRACGRLNRLATRIVTGVLLGKFAGDWIAWHLQQAYGTPAALRYGFAATLVLTLLWEDIQRAIDELEADAADDTDADADVGADQQ